MVSQIGVGLIAQAASGLVVLALGALLAWARPRKPYTMAFALFLGIWGAFIVAGNWAAYALVVAGDVGFGQRVMLLHAVLLMVAYLPLAYFACTYPPGEGERLLTPVTGSLLVLPAVAGAIALYLDPSLFLEGFSGQGSSTRTDWGPLQPTYSLLFAGASYLALWRFHHVQRTAEQAIERSRAGLLLLGLGLYVAFESAENLVLFGDGLLGVPLAGWDPVPAAFAAISLLGLAVIGLISIRTVRSEGLRWRGTNLGLAAIAASLALGAVSGLSIESAWLPLFVSDGLWRLGAVALLVYAVLRFELFGLEAGAARWVGGLGLFAGVTVGLVSVYVLLEQATGSGLISVVLLQGLLLGGVGLVSIRRPTWLQGARGWLGRATSSERSLQSLEIYEAALIGTRGMAREDRETELAVLRERLGITDDEHALLLRAVHSEPHPPVDPPPLREGDLVAERYRIRQELGTGSNAQVLEAYDTHLDRPVALKVLAPLLGSPEQAVRRFVHELRVSQRIEHPNVVAVYDFGYDDGRPYLVLEHVGGGTLADRIEEDGPLAPREAVRIIADLLSGLAHIHDQGLAHRDVKPSNILLTTEGRVKLTDLGLASLWRLDETLQLPSRTGSVEGTPAYMAPEVLQGAPAGPGSDIYSVGAVLYEALTGRHYLHLEGVTYETARRRILEQPPRSPADPVNSALAGVYERALQKRQISRFASARSMRAELLDVVRRLPADHRPSTQDPPASEGGDGEGGIVTGPRGSAGPGR